MLEKEFGYEIRKDDLINLDKYRIYIKMVMNGKATKAV